MIGEVSMNVQVIYHSKSGNTKKVADAIAAEMGVSAASYDRADIQEPVDLLFIGDGMYYGGISGEMKKFICSLDKNKIRTAAVFNTSGGSWWFGPGGIRKRLEKREISVLENTFHCHGGAFGIVFSSHPNDNDLQKAREFAKRAKQKAK